MATSDPTRPISAVGGILLRADWLPGEVGLRDQFDPNLRTALRLLPADGEARRSTRSWWIVAVMPSNLITTRFTAASTAADVVDGVELAGLRVIVTGGSSGIGIATARALAVAGAEVTVAVRDPVAGQAVADVIARNGAVVAPRVMRLDLADRRSVTEFTNAWDLPLHLLINNAGLVTSGLERTLEGWELSFATNHLGHFALASGLHAALAAGAGERDGSRIVSVSSTAHMRAGIDDIGPGSSASSEGADRIRRELASTPRTFTDRDGARTYWRSVRPAFALHYRVVHPRVQRVGVVK